MGKTLFSMESKALVCASVCVPTHSHRQGEREGPPGRWGFAFCSKGSANKSFTLQSV